MFHLCDFACEDGTKFEQEAGRKRDPREPRNLREVVRTITRRYWVRDDAGLDKVLQTTTVYLACAIICMTLKSDYIILHLLTVTSQHIYAQVSINDTTESYS